MLISGTLFNTSIKSTAPLWSICFFVIMVLLIDEEESEEELFNELVIWRHGIFD